MRPLQGYSLLRSSAGDDANGVDRLPPESTIPRQPFGAGFDLTLPQRLPHGRCCTLLSVRQQN